ncbi:MAG: DeoR/GlpR transcriptional regulator [Rhizobiales bacterium]|nr:DeoR/GlpR transcriptional regulator [Hyphomicrobiales bacterium]
MSDNERESVAPVGGRLIGRVRKERIVATIRSQGFMSSVALAELFQVSEMTIRRDLAELEMRGEIQRTHGGAVTEDPAARGKTPREPFFDERHLVNAEAKVRIAKAALTFVKPSQAIALDVGTTTFELARLIGPELGVRLFTNNLRIAATHAERNAEIYLFGGRLREKEMSLCGPVAVEQVRRLWFDVVFIGVSSITPQGIFDYSIEETEIKRVLIERSTRRIVVADSSKFDEMSLVQVANLQQFDVLISEAPPPPALASSLAAAGVEVVVAP